MWYILHFDKAGELDGHQAKRHICSGETVDGTSRSILSRGYQETKRERTDEIYFWIPAPSFADPATVSFDLQGLNCTFEVSCYDIFLYKANHRVIRRDLSIPTVKYHLTHCCLVLTQEEQNLFLKGMKNCYSEAIALAEIENRAWNKNLGDGSKVMLRPRRVGRVKVIEE